MDEIEYLKRKVDVLRRVAMERWPNHKIDEKVEEYMKDESGMSAYLKHENRKNGKLK